MRIGAYQFSVRGNVSENMKTIKKAIVVAANKDVRLLVFPECSLTGYPPINIEACRNIDFNHVEECLCELQQLSIEYDMYVIIGSVTLNDGKYYNSAVVFSPDANKIEPYHKRALWGWDRENFNMGNNMGIFKIDEFKIGVRICFEIRFPEYFRELYKVNTDLNIVMFYDISKNDDIERYELIKSHLKTRAVENVTTIVSVNAIKPYQTAPTAVFDGSGKVFCELLRNKEDLLIYEFESSVLSFSEDGRKSISDKIIK
ncbi:MAG: carbon-nitrogen hydrolase family protein [Clostridium sp.]